jgi:hypothetical protein
LAALTLAAAAAAPPAHAAAACPDYVLVGATGSGGDGVSAQPFTASSSYHGMGKTVDDVYTRVVHDLASHTNTATLDVQALPVDYDAVGVGPGFNLLDDINGVGAVFHVGPLGAYHDSVSGGTTAAINEVDEFLSRCSSTGVILGGYSQGAQALADALQGKASPSGHKMNLNRLVGAVFFGDPYFNPGADADHGDFDPGRSGLLGTRGEYPHDLLFPERRVHSWCRNKDPICQGLLSSSLIPFPDFDKNRHSAYRTEGSTADAANVVENLIRDDQATHGHPIADPLPSGVSGPLDVAFVIDTTGSMGGIIDSVKTDVTNIVSQLAGLDPDYRVALVDFKDAGSYCSSDPYQAQVDQPFTTDTAAFDTAVGGLFANGGCDYPESVYTGIMTGLDLPWRTGAHKLLIGIGDAPGHSPDPVTGYTAADVIAKSLSLDPVAVYGLGASSDADDTFRELADGTGGQVLSLDSAADVPQTISTAINTSATSPLAAAGGPYTGYLDAPTKLSAAASSSPLGRALSYEWDFDNDGTFDATSTSPIVNHTWTSAYDGPVTLRVTDSDGLSSVAQAQVTVQNPAPAAPGAPSPPTLTAGDGQVTANWQPASTGGPAGYYILADHSDPVAYITAAGPLSAVIDGLPNGTPVALNVTAVNVTGRSAPSADSNTVTPVSLNQDDHKPPVTSQSSPVARTASLSRLRLSPQTFRAAARGASISAVKRKVGTTVSYTQAVAAKTTFMVLVARPGRKGAHDACGAPTARNRTKRSCVRYVRVGSFTRSDRFGVNHFHFSGRVRGRALATGRYRLAATPRAAGHAGKTMQISFRVVG